MGFVVVFKEGVFAHQIVDNIKLNSSYLKVVN
jgi:hypothetical protein